MTGPLARIRWGLWVLDWRSHAIDICRDHPGGVYRAQCGHLLLGVVPLWERPVAAPCPTCATLQLELVQAAFDRAAAALGEVRSGGVTRRQQDEYDPPGRPPVGAGSAAPSSSPLPLVQLPAADRSHGLGTATPTAASGRVSPDPGTVCVRSRWRCPTADFSCPERHRTQIKSARSAVLPGSRAGERPSVGNLHAGLQGAPVAA
jgi:hypothetical protein